MVVDLILLEEISHRVRVLIDYSIYDAFYILAGHEVFVDALQEVVGEELVPDALGFALWIQEVLRAIANSSHHHSHTLWILRLKAALRTYNSIQDDTYFLDFLCFRWRNLSHS